MIKIILVQGPPASGKTTLVKEVMKDLKLIHNKSCAYICEDNFSKEMQYKYNARDLEV